MSRVIWHYAGDAVAIAVALWFLFDPEMPGADVGFFQAVAIFVILTSLWRIWRRWRQP
ncbi:MAG: hypothetical protein AAGF30_16460 [Pseudomonadota bacterium]